MKRLIASLLLVAAMAGTAAADVFVFETVDEFERRLDRLAFRGILQGQTEPTDLVVLTIFDEPDHTTACERMALMAMARPGRYFFTVTTFASTPDLVACRLIRR